MSSYLLNITIDCQRPQLVARFWAGVTGWSVSQPYSPQEYAVTGPAGVPRLYFTAVPEPKGAKNRVHLDIVPADRTQDEEIARLAGLGASVVSDQRPDVGWVVMADPEGNEFCLEPGS